MTAVWIIAAIVGFVGLIALIIYYHITQSRKITRLQIMEQAYRERDKIENKAREAHLHIDADLPQRITNARQRVLDDVRAASENCAASISDTKRDT